MHPSADVAAMARPISREEYARFVATGVFDDESVELIEGVIVRVPPPHGPEHDGTLHLLGRKLAAALGERAEVRIQCTLDAGERAQPEPDLAVVPSGDYRDAHPKSAWLVVEVADSSLRRDRTVKAAVYAACGVQEYWIVDLIHRTIEVRSEPTADGYARLVTLRRGDTLRPSGFVDVAIDVSDVLR